MTKAEKAKKEKEDEGKSIWERGIVSNGSIMMCAYSPIDWIAEDYQQMFDIWYWGIKFKEVPYECDECGCESVSRHPSDEDRKEMYEHLLRFVSLIEEEVESGNKEIFKDLKKIYDK